MVFVDFDKVKSLVDEFFNGQYEVKKFLGEGSFAEVYLVKHNFLDDLRAMKIIKEPIIPTTNIKSIFQEVMIATRLRHENIISIFDAGIISNSRENNADDFAFFVMEYVQGGDLEQYLNSFINSEILMPINRVLDLIEQILNGLNTLHMANPPIVHRDLKPKNILLSYNACGDIIVKISDFGFAKEVTTSISDIDIVGTRPYMAPECFDKRVSIMTDIYAVGVIFYQLLTNSYPFDIDKYSVEDLLDLKPWEIPLKPPSHFNQKIPKEIDEIVMKCLSVNPEDRYHNALELLSDVEVTINQFASSRLIGAAGSLNDDVEDYSDYVVNDSLICAFNLAKSENGLDDAIELLENEVLKDYQVRKCYGETLQMWKSKNPDVKLISKAFTVNLMGKNYKLSCELLAEAIAYNPLIKNKFASYIELWEIFIELSKQGNLIKAVISLERLMESDENINEIYVNIINTLKTYSVEEIVARAIHLVNMNNLVDASNLMEFAVVCDSKIRDKYAYKLSLWKQNMKSEFKMDGQLKENSIDYGIDLGTTDSIISYFNGGDPIIVKNRKTGDEFTPSAILIDGNNIVHVGEDARLALIEDEGDAISEFKQNMGFPVSFNFKKVSRRMFPEELSAEILKDLRISAYHQFGVNIEHAVICVPANSNYLKTKAVNDAADFAGFRSHSLILEPIAVAIAYDLKSNHDCNGNWLIYDLGGATFSTSLIRNNNGEIEKIDSIGLDNLGGNLFDWGIVDEIFAPEIAKDLNLDDFKKDNPKYKKIFSKLKIASEISKKELSKSVRTDVCINNLFRGYDFTCTLLRDELKEIIVPLIKPTFNLVKKLLEDNDLTSSEIDRLILVGGSCLSPVVQDLLDEEFDIELEYSLDPLTVVARGASIYAGSLEKPQFSIDADSFSTILNCKGNQIRGRVFVMDDKFSFLGYNIEFTNAETDYSSDKIPLNLDGTFKVELPKGDYSINIYCGDAPVRIDEKSPSSISNEEIWIDFFDKSFPLCDDEISVHGLTNRFAEVGKSIDYLKDYGYNFSKKEILNYVGRLMQIVQIDKNALLQTSIYLSYLESIVLCEKNDLDFLILLDNVKNKIRNAKEKNLFDIGDLEQELEDIVKTNNLNKLIDIYRGLIEDYVKLNQDVIVSCFINLKSEGIYTNNRELFDKLSKKASDALDNHDYDELLEIVNKLYEIDERSVN